MLRGAQLPVPFDGSVVDAWRECDVAGIARNFHREGMNILEPRIDWRGDGPGLVESEFPVFPWTMAAFYRVVGEHPLVGRSLAFLFSLGALVAGVALARFLLPERAALVAAGVLALSPLSIRLGTAIQPDGLMWLCYVLAVLAFMRWISGGTRGWYWTAMGATALAILAKASAAHIGFLFLALVLDQRGWRGLRDPKLWGFAAATLVPGALWYLHARGYWHAYGNSLGISSEHHWAGRDLLTNPRFVLRIAALDTLLVWTPAGLLLAGVAALGRWKERYVRWPLYWVAAVAVFYLAAARTTGDSWAAHYHVMMVVPAALLVGAGAGILLDRPGSRVWRRLAVATLGLALLLGVAGARSMVGTESRFIVILAGLIAVAAIFLFHAGRDTPEGPSVLAAGLGVAALLLPLLLSQVRQVWANLTPRENVAFACSAEFARIVPPGTLIATPGDRCFDEDGRATAYEAPFYFFWMERKGFSVCEERQSVATLLDLAQRGARFYVATSGSLSQRPGFEAELRSRFPLVAQCRGELLFQLSVPEPTATP